MFLAWVGWVAVIVAVVGFAVMFYLQRKRKAEDTASHHTV